jgi:putative serine protease PepD
VTAVDHQTTPTRPKRRTWRDLPASPPVGDAPPEQHAPPPPPPDDTVAVPAATPDEDARRGWVNRRNVLIAALAVLIVTGVVAVALALRGDDSEATTPTIPESSSGSASGSDPAAVASALGPAVVQIEIESGMGNGVGSGVIYDTSGLILTAHHVVAGNDEVTVRLADERTVSGRVVARAPEQDLAIVAIEGVEDLVAAPIADPDSVEVGEPAIALGSPFGFQQSVTAGIISGLERELETPAGLLTGLIQTDAPINPGNSGGPLADSAAQVIGINTAIASISGGNDGVGFAIPIEDAQPLMDEVAANGGVEAPTVAAPDEGGGLFDDIPGLDQLPGLDDLPGLSDIPGLGNLPNLDEMLQGMFDIESLPEDLRRLLEQLLAGQMPDLDQFGDLFGDLFGGGSGNGS